MFAQDGLLFCVDDIPYVRCEESDPAGMALPDGESYAKKPDAICYLDRIKPFRLVSLSFCVCTDMRIFMSGYSSRWACKHRCTYVL